jgi:preprotein translocase subunit SecD
VATTTTSRPGRTLVALGIVLVVLFGIMALTKEWKPKLGLDLRGGTTITLTATSLNGGSIDADKLAEAKDIISERVNGAGIGEADITTSGSNHIVVAVPGVNQESLVRQVGQTALLRFRVVYAVSPGAPQPTPTPTATPSAKPSSKPSSTPSKQPTAKPTRPATSQTPGNGAPAVATPTPSTPSTPAASPSTPAASPSTPGATPSAPGQPVTGDPLQ